MFPNFTGWSAIKAALFTLVTFDGIFMTAGVFSPPVTHYAMIVSLLLGGAGTVVTTLSGTGLATPSVARLARKAALAAAFCFMLAGAWACQACSAAQKTQEVTLGVDTLVCVLNHDTDPPPTIALECGVSDLTQIATILNAHKAAEIRDLYGSGDAGPHAANDNGILWTSPSAAACTQDGLTVYCDNGATFTLVPSDLSRLAGKVVVLTTHDQLARAVPVSP